jgi:hypothetical protein
VLDAELRQRPVIASTQQSIMMSCWRRDSDRPSFGKVLGAHGQGQVHVVLQRTHQIGIAAGGKQNEVESIVASWMPRRSCASAGAVFALQPDEVFDQFRGRGKLDHQRCLALQHLPNLIDPLQACRSYIED